MHWYYDQNGPSSLAHILTEISTSCGEWIVLTVTALAANQGERGGWKKFGSFDSQDGVTLLLGFLFLKTVILELKN
jgi:hypothetical protein